MYEGKIGKLAMGKLKDNEKKLFKEWKKAQAYNYFISDGLFDEQEYIKQNIHILFVLKEANWENGNGDLCEFLLSEESSSYWKTWNNVARWTQAILEGGEYPYRVSKSDKSYWLRKIAFLNLKKVGGDSVAEDETIRAYAERDAKFIKMQIELYEPDIIICCGRGNGKNADILHNIVFNQEEVTEWKAPIQTYNYFVYKPDKTKQVPVLSFYHPQMRGNHEKFKKRFEEIKSVTGVLKKEYVLEGN